MKVLVTGGTSQLGSRLVNEFLPNAVGVGRKNGWDLTKEQQRIEVTQMSLDCDVFVNYAYIDGLTQIDFLKRVASLWSDQKKSGLIVNFGSYLTFSSSPERRTSEYFRNKTILDTISSEWAKLGELGKVSFRVTNLKLGFLELEKSRAKPGFPGYGIDSPILADTIKMIYRCKDLSFPEVVLNVRQRYASRESI